MQIQSLSCDLQHHLQQPQQQNQQQQEQHLIDIVSHDSVFEDDRSNQDLKKTTVCNRTYENCTNVSDSSNTNNFIETGRHLPSVKYSDVVRTFSPNDIEVINDENWKIVSHLKNRTITSVKINTRDKRPIDVITGTLQTKTLSTVAQFDFLFVSRLGPDTDSSLISDYLNDYKKANYQVEKLTTKFSGYSSFKVGVPSSLFNEIFSSQFWPNGALVKKYRFPKNHLNLKESVPKDKT